MCFSATASFAAGTALLAIGSLAWRSAQRRCERPFAAIPVLFALQQFIEGTIWLAFDHDMPALNAVSTGAYLFFSHLLWPVFVPSAVLLIEPQAHRLRRRRDLVHFGLVLLCGVAERRRAVALQQPGGRRPTPDP